MGSCTKLVLFRIVEVLLTLGCLALHYQSFELFEDYTLLIITGTFGGYLVVLVGYFGSIILGEPIPRRAWIFYCLLGVGLFAASGVLAIQYQTSSSVQGTLNKAASWVDEKLGNDDILQKNQKTIGISKGSIAIVAAITFLVDAVFTFRSGAES